MEAMVEWCREDVVMFWGDSSDAQLSVSCLEQWFVGNSETVFEMLNEGTLISFKSYIQKQGYFPGSFVSSSTYHWNVEEHPQAWPGAPAGWDLSFHRGQKTQNEQVPQMGSENRASKKNMASKKNRPKCCLEGLSPGNYRGIFGRVSGCCTDAHPGSHNQNWGLNPLACGKAIAMFDYRRVYLLNQL